MTEQTSPASTASSTKPRRHIPALDGVRGVAVLAVLFFHAAPMVMGGGFLGVDVFFVLSGFLITIGLIRRIDAGRGVGFKTFWLKRARRLLPALGIMAVTTTALAWVAIRDFPAQLGVQWFGAATFSTNWILIFSGQDYFDQASPPFFQHLWSLAIEEQFYLLWPIVVFVLALVVGGKTLTATSRKARRARTWFALSLALISGALMVLGASSDADVSRLYFGTDTHLFGILFGASIAMYVASYDATEAQQPPLPSRSSRIAAWVITAVLCSAFFLVDGNSRITYQGVLFLFSLGTAFVVRYLVLQNLGERDLLTRMFSAKWLSWFGSRSYALYLWHWPLLIIAHTVAPAHENTAMHWLWTAAALLLTLMAAEVSYHLFEEPIIKHGFKAYGRKVVSFFNRAFDSVPGKGTRPKKSAAVVVVSAWLLLSAGAASALLYSPPQTALQAQIEAGQKAIADNKAASDDPSPEPAPQPDEPVMTPTVPPKPNLDFSERDMTRDMDAATFGDQMTFIGDSVMLGSAPAILDEMPGADINAEVAIQFDSQLNKLVNLNSQGLLRDTVVMSAGTNGTVTENQLEQLLDVVGPDRTVILVGPHGQRSWIPPAQKLLAKFSKKNPNVYFADWDAVAKFVPDFSGDGIHPGNEGTRIYSRLVRLTVDRTS